MTGRSLTYLIGAPSSASQQRHIWHPRIKIEPDIKGPGGKDIPALRRVPEGRLGLGRGGASGRATLIPLSTQLTSLDTSTRQLSSRLLWHAVSIRGRPRVD